MTLIEKISRLTPEMLKNHILGLPPCPNKLQGKNWLRPQDISTSKKMELDKKAKKYKK